MPRDNWCSQCGGMYHDDEMGRGFCCIYCEGGIDSPIGKLAETREPEGRDEGDGE